MLNIGFKPKEMSGRGGGQLSEFGSGHDAVVHLGAVRGRGPVLAVRAPHQGQSSGPAAGSSSRRLGSNLTRIQVRHTRPMCLRCIFFFCFAVVGFEGNLLNIFFVRDSITTGSFCLICFILRWLGLKGSHHYPIVLLLFFQQMHGSHFTPPPTTFCGSLS